MHDVEPVLHPDNRTAEAWHYKQYSFHFCCLLPLIWVLHSGPLLVSSRLANFAADKFMSVKWRPIKFFLSGVCYCFFFLFWSWPGGRGRRYAAWGYFWPLLFPFSTSWPDLRQVISFLGTLLQFWFLHFNRWSWKKYANWKCLWMCLEKVIFSEQNQRPTARKYIIHFRTRKYQINEALKTKLNVIDSYRNLLAKLIIQKLLKPMYMHMLFSCRSSVLKSAFKMWTGVLLLGFLVAVRNSWFLINNKNI